MTAVESAALDERLEEHRPALLAQCRWILGSASEADDAVQETMVRAWQRFAEFEGRGSLLSWLRSIARNVCLDMLRAQQRRARPADPASWLGADGFDGVLSGGEAGWDRPLASRPASAVDEDPAERTVRREQVRQAFVAALLHLPPRQRSALLLCEVLRWQASEVAQLLGTTVASVNSALQRARTTVGGRDGKQHPSPRLDDEQQALLHSCVQAFERHDVDSLAVLLRL